MALIVVFHNDASGTDESANYNVTVYVNQRVIATDRVEGHNRAQSWRELIRRLSNKNADRPPLGTNA